MSWTTGIPSPCRTRDLHGGPDSFRTSTIPPQYHTIPYQHPIAPSILGSTYFENMTHYDLCSKRNLSCGTANTPLTFDNLLRRPTSGCCTPFCKVESGHKIELIFSTVAPVSTFGTLKALHGIELAVPKFPTVFFATIKMHHFQRLAQL